MSRAVLATGPPASLQFPGFDSFLPGGFDQCGVSRFFGIPSNQSLRTSLTSSIVTSRNAIAALLGEGDPGRLVTPMGEGMFLQISPSPGVNPSANLSRPGSLPSASQHHAFASFGCGNQCAWTRASGEPRRGPLTTGEVSEVGRQGLLRFL